MTFYVKRHDKLRASDTDAGSVRRVIRLVLLLAAWSAVIWHLAPYMYGNG